MKKLLIFAFSLSFLYAMEDASKWKEQDIADAYQEFLKTYKNNNNEYLAIAFLNALHKDPESVFLKSTNDRSKAATLAQYTDEMIVRIASEGYGVGGVDKNAKVNLEALRPILETPQSVAPRDDPYRKYDAIKGNNKEAFIQLAKDTHNKRNPGEVTVQTVTQKKRIQWWNHGQALDDPTSVDIDQSTYDFINTLGTLQNDNLYHSYAIETNLNILKDNFSYGLKNINENNKPNGVYGHGSHYFQEFDTIYKDPKKDQNQFTGPRQGWKLHISCMPHSAHKVFMIVKDALDTLRNQYTWPTKFKIVWSVPAIRDMWYPDKPSTQSGKFITIYPQINLDDSDKSIKKFGFNNAPHTFQLIKEIDKALNDAIAKGDLNPRRDAYKLSDEGQVGTSGFVFLRYGKHISMNRSTGNYLVSLDKNGNFPDDQGNNVEESSGETIARKVIKNEAQPSVINMVENDDRESCIPISFRQNQNLWTLTKTPFEQLQLSYNIYKKKQDGTIDVQDLLNND